MNFQALGRLTSTMRSRSHNRVETPAGRMRSLQIVGDEPRRVREPRVGLWTAIEAGTEEHQHGRFLIMQSSRPAGTLPEQVPGADASIRPYVARAGAFV